MILKGLDREKINYGLPTLTLDVNQVALKDPSVWPPEMERLIAFEWNYFEKKNIELCITPETEKEIIQGIPVEALGSMAYSRYQKSQFFKSRPPGTTLALDEEEANKSWNTMRYILFPTVRDSQLTFNQKADVNQIFYHTVCSGTLEYSAFMTVDKNYHDHSTELQSELGIKVYYPDDAWHWLQPKFNLYSPNEEEVKTLLNDQRDYFQRLHNNNHDCLIGGR